MLYLKNSKLQDLLIDASITTSFDDIYKIAHAIPTTASVTSTQLQTIVEVFLKSALQSISFLDSVYDLSYYPPTTIALPDLWHEKTSPSPISEKYASNYGVKTDRIIIANIFSFLGKMPPIDDTSIEPIYPNNNSLYMQSIALSGSNEVIINSLMDLLNPIHMPITDYISMAEFYRLISKLIDLLSPANNYTSFQITSFGIPSIQTNILATTALENLAIKLEGGINKPFAIGSTTDYLSYYKLGEIIEEKRYVLVAPSVYDYLGAAYTLPSFNKAEYLNLSLLSANSVFVTQMDNIATLRNEILTSIKAAYINNNINYFIDAQDIENDMYLSLDNALITADSIVSVDNKFFIPFYSFL